MTPDPSAARTGRLRRMLILGCGGCALTAALGLGALVMAAFRIGARRGSGAGPTVPGPETPELIPRLKGAICTDPSPNAVLTHLPDLKSRPIAAASPETATVFPSIYTVSEPDRTGRVVYVENRMGTPATHSLLMTTGSGKPPRSFFVRPGDALWYHQIGEHLSLTADGSHVAYVRDAVGTQFPRAYLQQGVLEILDTRSGKATKTSIAALDQGLCWFPDGKRLAFVAPIPAASAPALPPGNDGFGAAFGGWNRVPTVCVLDTTTGQVRTLHVGWSPRVATDGRKVTVADMATAGGGRYVSRLRLVDVTTWTSKPVTLPGLVGDVVALWPDDTALYWGLPTAGTKTRTTRFNSPLVGPKLELTLKVGVLNTNQFATVVPYIDPRMRATWGPVP